MPPGPPEAPSSEVEEADPTATSLGGGPMPLPSGMEIGEVAGTSEPALDMPLIRLELPSAYPLFPEVSLVPVPVLPCIFALVLTIGGHSFFLVWAA